MKCVHERDPLRELKSEAGTISHCQKTQDYKRLPKSWLQASGLLVVFLCTLAHFHYTLNGFSRFGHKQHLPGTWPGKRCFRYIKHCLGKQFDKPSWLKSLGSIWPKVHSPVGEKRTVGFAFCCHSRGRRSGTERGGAYYVNKCAATPLQFSLSDGAYDVALEFRAKVTWFGEREREPISLLLWSPMLWTPGVHTWCGHTWDDNMVTDHQHCPQGPWPLVGSGLFKLLGSIALHAFPPCEGRKGRNGPKC